MNPPVQFATLWWLPRKYRAITLPPACIFVRKELLEDWPLANLERLLDHEEVHWQQYLEMGLVRFYAKYIYYWLKYGYDLHPMEIEARAESGVA